LRAWEKKIWQSFPEATCARSKSRTIRRQFKNRPDPSGIALSLVEGLQKETGAKEMLLVGNSMGAGVLLWDAEKISQMEGMHLLAISPTERFMPPVESIGTLAKTTIIALNPKKDNWLRSPEAKAWVESNASPLIENLSHLANEDNPHLIIGDNLPHEEVVRLIQALKQ
jgi:hypothetical protein